MVKFIEWVAAIKEFNMPSVDVVSKVDLQAMDNAINNVKREILTRFDFRNVNTEIAFDRKARSIHIVSGDDLRIKTITELIVGQLARFKVDAKCLNLKEIETVSASRAKMEISIKEGIPIDISRKIAKLIKELKLKVQAAIQDEQVRITGKKIDDLQEIMRLLKEQDYDIPLQFTNMKS
jgi:hypothetical protein